jgi:hypothetical protein
MKDSLFAAEGSKPRDKLDTIDALFSEDQEYKMRLAS